MLCLTGFVSVRSKVVPVSGPLIQAEALEMVNKLDKDTISRHLMFGSRSLYSHNIVFDSVCGEANYGGMQTVTD